MENISRNCPMCSKLIYYKTKKSLSNAIRKNTKCRLCNSIGENNPFYGKTHSEKVRKMLSDFRETNLEVFRSDVFKDKMSIISSGGKNPMSGRSFYDIWVEKYGKETADKKMIEFKKKQSVNNSGKNNNMYGKPSPNGSGNGWSGWYNDYFFKSLKELSCMLTFEKMGYSWESAERKKFRIKYIDWDGSERNYYPDFFLSDRKIIIECKPEHLWESANVVCKRKYAEKFCKEKGYTYEFMNPVRLTDSIILELHDNGSVKFIDRYEEKFKIKYKI